MTQILLISIINSLRPLKVSNLCIIIILFKPHFVFSLSFVKFNIHLRLNSECLGEANC